MTMIALSIGKQVAIIVAVDHLSANCVGLHAAERFIRTLKDNLLWLKPSSASSTCNEPAGSSRTSAANIGFERHGYCIPSQFIRDETDENSIAA
ncbi:MAG: hypothetical protein ISN28_12460 [Ectothiorhodospiraceae bacterium AqS1]|nr:hypothetical protein [Ectothiorhodospiraceae bacterium AqS1]